MGSPETEVGHGEDETQHEVTLTHDFLISSTEVTQDEFEARMGYNPSTFGDCGSCPVETVRWPEAAAYCNALSDSEGLPRCYECEGSEAGLVCSLAYRSPYECTGYRLPTEAEWEYAARAGTTTATYNGDLDDEGCSSAVVGPIAWYCGNAHHQTHEVGTRGASGWGLYDMAGNVWEWCQDWYGEYGARAATNPWGLRMGTYRVGRGGSWYYGARFARAADRCRTFGSLSSELLGFRPVRTSP